jgi:signal transduction histidine kinase
MIEVEAANCSIPSPSDLSLKPGNYVRVTVTDQGIGIPQDHLSKIFDPYFTTKQKGTGLRLSSCQTIIESHNGSITYSNNPSTFKILIPKLELGTKNVK